MFKEFLKHLFPRIVRKGDLRITYTFCLGGLAFTAFLLLVASGLPMLFYYQPSPEKAFNSVLFLESSVWGGRYLRSLHRLASHSFLVLIFLHTLRVILTGAYRKPRELNWLIGFTLLCLAIFSAYTGYLLPMDQLSLWATQTGMELVNSTFLGSTVLGILVPDGVGQPMSLLRFYILHILLAPLSALLLSFLHFYRIRKDKGVLPYL
ncbi:MAG: cytochrome b N-terminal domain-containing protein [Syntrophales bacterium]